MSKKTKNAFSLIELVIVVVIIGIIAAIAIPKLSRGAAGAGDSSLKGDLKVIRTALDAYAAEHGGNYPTAAQLTGNDGTTNYLLGYTDDVGSGVVTTKDAGHIFGPYLRTIPPLPVGANKGNTGIATAAAAGVGWIYTPTTGTVAASATESDATGTAYAQY